jgi:hypothetical protein
MGFLPFVTTHFNTAVLTIHDIPVNQGESAGLAGFFLHFLAIVQISSWLSKAVPFIKLGLCLRASWNETS